MCVVYMYTSSYVLFSKLKYPPFPFREWFFSGSRLLECVQLHILVLFIMLQANMSTFWVPYTCTIYTYMLLNTKKSQFIHHVGSPHPGFCFFSCFWGLGSCPVVQQLETCQPVHWSSVCPVDIHFPAYVRFRLIITFASKGHINR